MKLAYASLAALLLCSFSAFADPAPASPPEAEIEKVYQVLCHPQSKEARALEGDEKKEADQSRAAYLAFLDSPDLDVGNFRAHHAIRRKNPDFTGSIELAVRFFATCGITELFAKDIAERGCYGDDGKNHSAARALELCQPLLDTSRQPNP